MNKKGIEIAINFIVMLILAVTVFGFGLFFVRNLFSEAGEIKAQLDRDSERNIELLLSRGERVAFPISSKEINAGDAAVFGLGVLNVLSEDQNTFYVDIECTTAIDRKNEVIIGACADAGFFEIEPFTLTKNDQKVIPIAVQPPRSASKGDTYAFTISVSTDPAVKSNPSGVEIYGGAPKQIYVTIG